MQCRIAFLTFVNVQCINVLYWLWPWTKYCKKIQQGYMYYQTYNKIKKFYSLDSFSVILKINWVTDLDLEQKSSKSMWFELILKDLTITLRIRINN